MLVNKGQCSEFAAKTLEGVEITEALGTLQDAIDNVSDDLDALEDKVDNYIDTDKWLPYSLDDHDDITHENFLKLINGHYLGLVYQDQNTFDMHYYVLFKANYDTETYVPESVIFYEYVPSTFTSNVISFIGGTGGKLEYEDDGIHAFNKAIEHNIVCRVPGGLPYMTLRIINHSTDKINTIAKLATALYSYGYTTTEKACSASGDFGIADSSYPIMGVMSANGDSISIVSTNGSHTNISNFNMSSSVTIYDDNIRALN